MIINFWTNHANANTPAAKSQAAAGWNFGDYAVYRGRSAIGWKLRPISIFGVLAKLPALSGVRAPSRNPENCDLLQIPAQSPQNIGRLTIIIVAYGHTFSRLVKEQTALCPGIFVCGRMQLRD